MLLVLTLQTTKCIFLLLKNNLSFRKMTEKTMAILGGMKMSLSMILKGQFIFVSIQAPYSYEKICYKK